MSKVSKRHKANLSQVDVDKLYPVTEALELLKKISSAKFVESIEIAVNLGIDSRKSDQVVRGSTALPHGTGKTVNVAVFAQGDQATEAQQAGADKVGWEDLVEDMKKGELNYDVVIATPDAMPMVGKLGQVLGPKGLMPNPKVGTVSADIANAVASFKAGKVRYRADKGGVVHTSVGKVDFEIPALVENIQVLMADLRKQNPASAKGVYLKKVTLSSTMGPGVGIDISTL
jgi:large subunit ribosomal protein L1